MSNTDQVIRGAIAGLIALGVVAGSGQALAAKGDNEKCAGVVKAGKNDCGTSTNACAGQVTKDNHPEAWIFVPTGVCERISGGRLVTGSQAGKTGTSTKG